MDYQMEVTNQTKTEMQATISYYVNAFLEKNQEEISQLTAGKRLHKRETWIDDDKRERYDFSFTYIKAFLLGMDEIEVFLNDRFVARIRC